MSSNGSNVSLFGSQGSTRNFTSLLNPSYLQSSNGKESHKRETDGKCFNMVTYSFWLLFSLALPACTSKGSVCGDWSFCFAHPAWESSRVVYMSSPTLYVLFAVHHARPVNASWPCYSTYLARIPTRFVLEYQLRFDRTLYLEFAFLDLDECVEVWRYRNVILVIP